MTLIGGILSLCKDAVSVFYSPSQLGIDFQLDTIEKQVIINPSSNNSKSYVSLVFRDFKVTFLGKGKA